MPGNEFEKQVQKQLDNFQLNPSAAVWKNVEMQIRKKKRRRIIFFFLLTALLGTLGYSGYRLVTTQQRIGADRQTSEATNKSITNSNENVNSSTDIKKSTKITEGTTTKTGLNNSPASLPENSPVTNYAKDKQQGKPPLSKILQPRHHVNDQIIITKKGSQSFDQKQSKQVDEKAVVVEKPERSVTPGNALLNSTEKNKANPEVKSAPDNKSNSVEQKAIQIIPAKDSIGTKRDSVNPTDLASAVNPVAAKPHSHSSRINWGIDISLGVTSSQEGAFSLVKSYNAGVYNTNSPSAVAALPGGSLILPPSLIKPGMAFRIGVVAETQFSKRSKVSLGLQYAYASNHIKTGTADKALRLQNASFSATIDQVYRGPQNNSYVNNYHFISLPVTYHWMFGKKNKLPLQWNIELSPGYLVATDALIYSSSDGGSYYADKNAFNKFHLGFGTGLSYRMNAKNGMQISFGPEVSFDTRRLINSASERKQYLIFWGVGTRVLMAQKKK